MITAVVLLTYAATVALVPGRWLATARWPHRRPRLALALWLALDLAAISSVVLAVAVTGLRFLPSTFTAGLDDLLARCAMVLYDSTPGPLLPVAMTGAILGTFAAGAAVLAFASSVRRDRRNRQSHRAQLRLVGTHDTQRGVLIVADPRPSAYCLPGRRNDEHVVVTTGAVDLLDEDQLQLVIAHEIAHVRQAHTVVARVTTVLASTFAFIPLFRQAQTVVPTLLEMAADDAAIRANPGPPRHEPQAAARLAHALVAMAVGSNAAPQSALAAAGTSVQARVLRLASDDDDEQTTQLLAGSVIAASILAALTPTLVAAAPALCAALMRLCPVTMQ